jgi:hypothetical protein
MEICMRRRLFLTAAPMAILLGVAGVPTETRAKPPSWAPAHGWRRKTGNESDFTGKKNKSNARSRDLDDLDREEALTRRERALVRQERQERQERLARRERKLDRIDRQNRLAERERAMRERRRALQLGLIP